MGDFFQQSVRDFIAAGPPESICKAWPPRTKFFSVLSAALGTPPELTIDERVATLEAELAELRAAHRERVSPIITGREVVAAMRELRRR